MTETEKLTRILVAALSDLCEDGCAVFTAANDRQIKNIEMVSYSLRSLREDLGIGYLRNNGIEDDQQ